MTEIKRCKNCPFHKKYDWPGSNHRCKHSKTVRKHGRYGRAVGNIESLPHFCPLPEYDIEQKTIIEK